MARDAHIHDIVVVEVHLGGAARALDDDNFIFLVEPRQRLFHRVEQFHRIAFVIFLRRHVADRLSHQHHLRRGVSRGLQKHRVHIDLRRDPRRLRLRHLRAPHFLSVPRDIGIQRHILRLERNDVQPVLIKNTAKRRDENAFPHMRTGSLHHDRFCHAIYPPRKKSFFALYHSFCIAFFIIP